MPAFARARFAYRLSIASSKKWTCRESNPGLKTSTSNFYMLSPSLDLRVVQEWDENTHNPDSLSQKRWVEKVTVFACCYPPTSRRLSEGRTWLQLSSHGELAAREG